MPHKHKRNRSIDPSSFDLPPTTLARPLPVSRDCSTTTTSRRPPGKVKKPLEDDTPRAFTRLLNYTLKGRKIPSGLDDSARSSSKKRKRGTDASNAQHPVASRPSETSNLLLNPPQILPSESLSVFAARVDAALPMGGLVRSQRSGGVNDKGSRQSRTERKMQKMQQEWRENDRRRRERAEEQEDELANETDEIGISRRLKSTQRTAGAGKTNGTKKAKRRRKHQNPTDSLQTPDEDEDEDDPWAAIARKRAQQQPAADIPSAAGTRGHSLIGLHDVVLAPPKLTSVPRMKIKAGSAHPGTERGRAHQIMPGLRGQAELSAARRDVIERYRRMMRERRGEDPGI